MTPCGGTWRAVEPTGYVCEGSGGITGKLDDPGVVAATERYLPKNDSLPYRYGMSLGTPLYARVPTAAEQVATEPDLAAWRAQVAKDREKSPPEKLPPLTAVPVETMPEFLANGAMAPPMIPWLVPNKQLSPGYAIPGRRLAFVSAFDVDGRTFYLTSESLVVPADRIKAARASDFHGIELARAGAAGGERLPIAWVRWQPVTVYELDADNKATATETKLPVHAHVALADKPTITWLGHGQYWEILDAKAALGEAAKEGTRYAVPAYQATRIDAAGRTPEKIGEHELWLDVSLTQEALVAYEGLEPIFVTLVSTGTGDKHATPTGVFRVYQKHLTSDMSGLEKPPEKEGEEGEHAYRFDDVPWVQYVVAGIALHTAFWHDRFGLPASHGCINLSPLDAKWLFERTQPPVPPGWHGISAGYAGTPLGTVVLIHT
jgi:hypothetical protein